VKAAESTPWCCCWTYTFCSCGGKY